MIKYQLPTQWIRYDAIQLVDELTEAKATVMSLKNMPYQRAWAESLQDMQLKREVAGTSRIEGAEFTETELEQALRDNTPNALFTRSQRQARAAKLTYQWIARLPEDVPINLSMILETHERIITDADDDHCPAGRIRGKEQNVTFGVPPHRGAEGGPECEEAFKKLIHAIEREYPAHDILIQALAMHYHFAAIHPFIDGNGRTARALEALVLQRAGLRDSLFIAMSNYYYDEKNQYLTALSESQGSNHDLTPFLRFGLHGISLQCRRLFAEIKRHLDKALFKNVMYDLFNRLKNTRKRVIAERQLKMLSVLLEHDDLAISEFLRQVDREYSTLTAPTQAMIRDLNILIGLNAINAHQPDQNQQWRVKINLNWATEITETEFFKEIKKLPKAKTFSFLD